MKKTSHRLLIKKIKSKSDAIFIALTLMVISLIPSNSYAQNFPQKPTDVIVNIVSEKNMSDEIEALGTLYANESVDLTATVTEIITEINFKDGQQVKRGDVLVKMSASEEAAELAEEKSRFDEADLQLQKLEQLLKSGSITRTAVDKQRLEVQTSRARLNAIGSRINQRAVKAPFDGVVGLRQISLGSLVQPGTLITTIDDNSVMKLDFSIPTVFLEALKNGLKIKATSDAFQSRVFEGEVVSIDTRINESTRSIMVRAILQNDEDILKPGLLMKVKLYENTRNAILIPEDSITQSGSNKYVFLAETKDGKLIAKKTNIEIGMRKKGWVEIISGLEVDEQVITHGIIKIKDGSEINILATQKGDENIEDLLNSVKEKSKDPSISAPKF